MKFIAALAFLIAGSGAMMQPAYRIGEIEVPVFSTPVLDSAKFRSLHSAVAPGGDDERWTEIPWITDLNAARAAAARESKPLFMWIMDGHPLGCT